MEKYLYCTYLHHRNPFLKIAPFKYEFLSMNPEVGLIHDFVSKNQTSKMKMDAKYKMKSTPYIAVEDPEAYSRWRTSKVMYMNERLNYNAMEISRNIELVTNCVLSRKKYDSENFQVLKNNQNLTGFFSR